MYRREVQDLYALVNLQAQQEQVGWRNAGHPLSTVCNLVLVARIAQLLQQPIQKEFTLGTGKSKAQE